MEIRLIILLYFPFSLSFRASVSYCALRGLILYAAEQPDHHGLAFWFPCFDSTSYHHLSFWGFFCLSSSFFHVF